MGDRNISLLQSSHKTSEPRAINIAPLGGCTASWQIPKTDYFFGVLPGVALGCAPAGEGFVSALGFAAGSAVFGVDRDLT